MDNASAKLIGSGIAWVALVGAGIGIGVIFMGLIDAWARNPAAQMTTQVYIGCAVAEATGLFGFVVTLTILFGT